MFYAPMSTDDYKLTRSSLEKAYASAADEGCRIKILVVTNPDNPLGIVHSEAEIKDMISWCIDRRVHLVCDEVYANCVYREGGAKFVSAIDIVHKYWGNDYALCREYIHVMFGLSKDFGLSGYRVGYLYSNNDVLLRALGTIVVGKGVSGDTQMRLAPLLGDPDWLDEFLGAATGELLLSYKACTAILDEAGIPYLPATAGMFVWIDLRKWLTAPTEEGEMELFDTIFKKCRFLMTPGSAMRAGEAGYFRICFAWHERDGMELGLRRCVNWLNANHKG